MELNTTIDAAVQGCPIFNGLGNIIGMAVLRAGSGAGTLAIPAERLKQFLEDCCTDGQRGERKE
jgi:NAD(P)H-hydrate repair Nnr-like enzyme with NAD(P)H-hydrate dehydratase domain